MSRRPRHPTGRGSGSSFGGGRGYNNNSNGHGTSGGREMGDLRLCKNFLIGGDNPSGGCHYGANCKFSHVIQRVADVVPPQQTGNLVSTGGGKLSEVKGVATTIDGAGHPQIFTGSGDGVVRQWNLERWTADRPIQLLGEIGCVLASHPFLVCGYEGATTIPQVPVGLSRIWNVETGQEIDLGLGEDGQAVQPQPPAAGVASVAKPPTTHGRKVDCVAVRPKPAENILEVYTGGADGTINFWQLHVTTGQVRLGQRLEGHVRGVKCLQLFPSSAPTSLLSGSADHTIRWWNLDDAETKTCRGALSAAESGHSGEVTAIAAFALDNAEYFASGSKDRSLKVWDAMGAIQVSIVTHSPILALDTALSAGPNGSPILVVGLQDGTVELRQPNPGFMLRASISPNTAGGPGGGPSHHRPPPSGVGHKGAVNDLICSANFFCSAAADGHLMVWQWKQPLPQPQINNNTSK